MDSTPPRVVSATPANGTAGVSRTAPLSATFSEGVRASTVTSATLTLRSPLETVGGAVSLSGATATFTPTQTLTPGTTYSVRISTGVQDLAGNALAVWDQSTGSLYNIWVNRYTAGTGWGAAALMPTDLSLYGLSPQIAFDGRGNAQALWTQTDAMGGNSLVACPYK